MNSDQVSLSIFERHYKLDNLSFREGGFSMLSLLKNNLEIFQFQKCFSVFTILF